MKLNKVKPLVALVLVLCMAFSLSAAAIAASTKYAKAGGINSGASYLFVEGGTAYTSGMSSNSASVSVSGSTASASSSLSAFEITTESAGGSSCYLKNADGDYLCFEHTTTTIVINELIDDVWQETDSYTSAEKSSIYVSDSKLNTTSSSQSESVEGNKETVIIETTSYSPVWKVYGSGPYSFSSTISVDGVDAKRYLAVGDYGLSASSSKSAFNLYSYVNECKVTFDPNGGENAPDAVTVTSGSTISEPSKKPEKEGADFAGWGKTKDGSKFNFSTKITSDMTLYAIWTPYIYMVEFDANGGDGSMPNQEFSYGENQRLSLNAFSKEGFKFDGWATSKSGEVKYGNGESVSNLSEKDGDTVTLYAVWKELEKDEKPEDLPAATLPEDSADGTFTLTIRYVDENGKDIAYEETLKLEDGSIYTATPIEIDGYTPDRDQYAVRIEGEDETLEITYTAEKTGMGLGWTIAVIVIVLLCGTGVTILVIRYKKGTLNK